MLLSALLAALAVLATADASSLDQRASPRYPPKGRSQGFRLVVNVTDLAHDFSPSVQYTYITSIHTGPTQNLLGISERGKARVFYTNGTATEFLLGQATTVSDGATPPVPYGFSLHPDGSGSAMSTAHLDAGLGDRGYVLTRFPIPYSFLAPEQMAVCFESVPYYGGKFLHVVKQLNLNIDTALPGNCAPVRLMAECADLDKLQPDSIAKHDHVYEAECYSQVSALEWPKYGPW